MPQTPAGSIGTYINHFLSNTATEEVPSQVFCVSYQPETFRARRRYAGLGSSYGPYFPAIDLRRSSSAWEMGTVLADWPLVLKESAF